MTETLLHIAQAGQALTLQAAWQTVAQAQGGAGPWHGLAYAPGHHICREQLQASDLAGDADIYEARLFNVGLELRWQRDTEPRASAAGLGQAVLLSEQALPLPGWHVQPLACTARLAGQYLMADGRRLGFDEYLAPAPGLAGDDGNLCIVEQRLRTLEKRHIE